MKSAGKVKGVTDLPFNMTLVKSAKGGLIRSAPRTESSSYLKLFTINIERFRLRQEQENLAKRRFQIEARMARNQSRLDEIRTTMHSQAQCIAEEEAGGTSAPPPRKTPSSRKWRTVAADY